MSAPVLWILIPAGVGLVLALFSGSPRFTFTFALVLAFLLAWAALLLPIDQPLAVGGFAFKLTPTFFFLGRSLDLTVSDQPLLLGVWGLVFLWLAGGLFAQPPRLFAPAVLVAVALLTAALAVTPFLYAALLFELTAMLFVPLLAPQGRGSRGVLRMLAFMTIGMTFILFVGWMLEGAAASPGIPVLTLRAGVLLGLGFAFLMAVFPFHSWVPMLMEGADLYSAAFLLFMLPGAVALFGLELVDRFVWLRQSPTLFTLLLAGGAIMVLVGGLLAGLERRLDRQLGFAILLETGMSMLAVAVLQSTGLALFFALLLPRGISLLVWAASLANLSQQPRVDLSLAGVKGLAGRYALRFAAILMAIFSLAGLPLLSGFPFRMLLIQNLAVDSPWVAGAVLLGNFGLMASGLRIIASIVSEAPRPDLSVAVTGDELERARTPDFPAWLFISVAGAGSLVVGLFPQWFWPLFDRLPAIFTQLGH
ncbi:MAG: hypothetical protein EPO32_02945 [Anaerolineae bacterium]|nr:MAG: hypothetical protein EPO32_02945 [Anaerolineae bacterium]